MKGRRSLPSCLPACLCCYHVVSSSHLCSSLFADHAFELPQQSHIGNWCGQLGPLIASHWLLPCALLHAHKIHACRHACTWVHSHKTGHAVELHLPAFQPDRDESYQLHQLHACCPCMHFTLPHACMVEILPPRSILTL